MSYLRVIPRDLFNESNLLKCYGQIYLNLERVRADAHLDGGYDASPFEVLQNEDGETWLGNIALIVRGYELTLRRPLNSRESWPLWAYPDEDTEIPVFNADGSFTVEMLAFLVGEANPRSATSPIP